MDLKDVFDQIVNRMERAKEKEIKPEITSVRGDEIVPQVTPREDHSS